MDVKLMMCVCVCIYIYVDEYLYRYKNHASFNIPIKQKVLQQITDDHKSFSRIPFQSENSHFQ